MRNTICYTASDKAIHNYSASCDQKHARKDRDLFKSVTYGVTSYFLQLRCCELKLKMLSLAHNTCRHAEFHTNIRPYTEESFASLCNLHHICHYPGILMKQNI
jgi:hypothetical protein